MPNIPFRFGRGRGLERSPARQTQGDYLEFADVSSETRDVAEKRRGAIEVGRTRSADPSDLIPADAPHAVWYRADELCTEAEGRLYGRQKCGTEGGETPAGTATPEEITDALAALTEVTEPPQVVEVPYLGADAFSAAALDRSRINDTFSPPVVSGATTWTLAAADPVSATFSIAATGAIGTRDFADAVGPRLSSAPGDTMVVWWVGRTDGQIHTQRLDVSGAAIVDVGSETTEGSIYNGRNGRLAVDAATTRAVWIDGSGQIVERRLPSFQSELRRTTVAPTVAPALTTGRYHLDVEFTAADGTEFTVVYSAADTDTNPISQSVRVVQVDGTGPGATDPLVITDQQSYGVTDWLTDTDISVAPGSYVSDVGRITPGLGIALNGADIYVAVSDLDLVIRVQFGDPTLGLMSGAGLLTQRWDLSGGEARVRVRDSLSGKYWTEDVNTGTLDNAAASAVAVGRIDTDAVRVLASTGNLVRAVEYRPSTDGAQLLTIAADTQLRPGLAVDRDTTRTGVAWVAGDDITVQVWAPTLATVIERTVDVTSVATPATEPILGLAVRDPDGVADADLTVAFCTDDERLAVTTISSTAVLIDSIVGEATPGATATAVLMAPGHPDSRAMVALEYDGGKEVYEAAPEADPPLFARVFPALLGLDIGDWRDVGPWARGRSRETIGQSGGEQVLSSSRGRIGECWLEAIETASDGIVARVVSDGSETTFSVDPIGSDVKIVTLSAEELIVSWISGEGGATSLFRARWAPGQSSVTPVLVAGPARLFGDGDPEVWDVHADDVQGVVSWTWERPTANAQKLIAIENVAGDTIGFDADPAAVLDFNVDYVTRYDCSVFVSRREFVGFPDEVDIYWSHVGEAAGTGNNLVQTQRGRYDRDGNLLILNDATATNFGTAVTSRALTTAVDTRTADDRFYIALEYVFNSVRYVQLVERIFGGGSSTLRFWPRTAIATHAVNIGGPPYLVLTPLGEAALANCQVLTKMAADDQEIAARSWIGQTRDETDLVTETDKSTIARTDATLTWSVAGYPVAGRDLGVARSTTQTQVDVTGRPNHPAVIDAVAASAHAGYPRVYDGDAVYEQDWHALPEFLGVTTVLGSLTAGVYTVAATWSWIDALGNRYRSAPTLATFTSTGDAVSAAWTLLAHTERPDDRLRIEFWVSEAGGSTLRFFASADGYTNSTTDRTGVILADAGIPPLALADAEVLDTALQGGTQGPITDFCAVAGGRLWGRDPKRGAVARFSLFGVDKEGRRWDTGRVTLYDGDPQEAITAVYELDARTVIGSVNGWWRLDGSGPSNVGAGSYPPPVLIPTSIGPATYEAIARMPMGLAYGSARGPYVLTRGLATQDVGDRVSRQYDIDDGRIVAVAYDAQRGEVVWGDANQPTLTWHVESARWTEQPTRQLRDLARSISGRLAILTSDGRFLEHRDDLSPTVYDADQSVLDVAGAAPYTANLDPEGPFVTGRAWCGDATDRLVGHPIEPSDGAAIAVGTASGAFGDRAYEIPSFTAKWVVQDLADSPAATILDASGKWIGVWAMRVGAVPNSGTLVGKRGEDGFGWAIRYVGGEFVLDVFERPGVIDVDTAPLGGVTEGEYIGLAICIVGGPDGVATYTVVATTAAGTVTLTAGGSGDSRTNGAPTIGDVDAPEIALKQATDAWIVYPGQLDAVALATLASDARTASLDASNVTALRKRADGDAGYAMTISTPWIRYPTGDARFAGGDGRITPSYRLQYMRLLGEYVAPHALEMELYQDFDDRQPVATATISAAQIVAGYLADNTYRWEWKRSGQDYAYAYRLVVRDDARPHETARLEAIDVAVDANGVDQAEMPLARRVRED